MKKRYISMNEVHGLMQNIIRDICRDSWRPDYIVGLTRGGLTPAVMISHYLDVPMETLKINLRDGGETESNTWMAEDAFNGKNILVVDDINDSGATLNWLMQDWPGSCYPNDDDIWDNVWASNVRFAVLVDNLASQCRVGTHYAGMEIDKAQDDQWIVFPWENWWESA